VHAAGVNPTDWKHRAHRIFLGPPPFVLGAFPLAEAAKAHEIGDGGHVAGKLVLTMA
jgi:NADPH:quinone reductase-like Zn-dependent oxidoreductase